VSRAVGAGSDRVQSLPPGLVRADVGQIERDQLPLSIPILFKSVFYGFLFLLILQENRNTREGSLWGNFKRLN
jgi:hypothetical protein